MMEVGEPGTKINCYGLDAEDYAAQSLTIVRLDTGEILRTFRRSDDPYIDGNIDENVVTRSILRSPMTGTPVAYPGRTGAIADRIFVGDRDGTLWRLDTSSPNPAKWKLQIFFDAYYETEDTDANKNKRQPIATAPVLSVTRDGEVTVAFSTGDQDVITAKSEMTNYLWSLTEKRVGSNFKAHVNWSQPFNGGQRVTGPMAVFNQAIYFSTFAPTAATDNDACQVGTSLVWGMHYINNATTGEGGEGMLPLTPDNPAAGELTQSLAASASTLRS